MKKPLIIIAVIFTLALTAYLVAKIGFSYFTSPIGNSSEKVEFQVKKGWTHSHVARKLSEQGFIRNWFVYSIYVKMYREEAKVYPGTFYVSKDMSINEIISTLDVSQVVKEIEITIPEGKNSFEIADMLTKPLPVKDHPEELVELNISAKRFIELINDKNFIREVMDKYPVSVNNLEGLLFPALHYIPENYTEEKIIKFMVKAFFNKFEEEICPVEKIDEKLKNIEPLNFQQMLTLASLVEKETAADNERKLIAGVYFHRIKTRGWRLDADPTIEYGLKLAGRWKGTIKDSLGINPATGNINMDAFNSEYNTYRKEGLPPTAIANPGMASVKAALNPEETEYFFFVAKNDGSRGHYFAKTLTQHNKNIAKSNRNSQ